MFDGPFDLNTQPSSISYTSNFSERKMLVDLLSARLKRSRNTGVSRVLTNVRLNMDVLGGPVAFPSAEEEFRLSLRIRASSPNTSPYTRQPPSVFA